MLFYKNVLIFFGTNKCGLLTSLPGIYVLVLSVGYSENTHSFTVPSREVPYDIHFNLTLSWVRECEMMFN